MEEMEAMEALMGAKNKHIGTGQSQNKQ